MRARTVPRLALPLLAALGAVACASRAPQDPGAPPRPGPVPAVGLAAEAIAGADSFLVRLATSRGDVDLMIRRHWAPAGAARVGEAVAAGYYDGARFFRALRGFVVQWGIAADSARTAGWSGRRIPDDPVTQSNRRGTVSFASGGPGTRTVQLFVNLRDNPRLDWLGFPPVGEVVAGMDAVDALHTGYGEAPSQREITAQGEAYLAREFPLLDRIVTAQVIRAWPSTPTRPPGAAGASTPAPRSSPPAP
jgi:peptidyl-prolyl cis-trans isomerase A (cyclophilin A)